VDRFLAKLERKYGRFAFEYLTQFIVGGMALVFVLSRLREGFESALVLDPNAIAHGQYWRLVTYLFLPRTDSILFILFSLSWAWTIGTSLQAEWGALKFNVFYFMGMLGTTAAAWIVGQAEGNFWLNMSCLLAFATLFPDFEFNPLIFVPISIRVKWLGILAGLYALYTALAGDWYDRAAIGAALGNYLLFFGGTLYGMLKSRNVQVRQAARRAENLDVADKPTGGRSCAVCGKAEDDDADIRKCTCDKCKPFRNLCLEHARNH
jgi:membrane associated rhomboid family serine protease